MPGNKQKQTKRAFLYGNCNDRENLPHPRRRQDRPSRYVDRDCSVLQWGFNQFNNLSVTGSLWMAQRRRTPHFAFGPVLHFPCVLFLSVPLGLTVPKTADKRE